MHKVLKNDLPFEEIDSWLNAVEKSIGSIQSVVSCHALRSASHANPQAPLYRVVVWVKERTRIVGKKKENLMTSQQFEEFWKLYPKKVGKGAAEKSFLKLSADLFDRVIAAVGMQVDLWNAEKREKKYIPNPATWLNQERWKDQPAETQPQLGEADYYTS